MLRKEKIKARKFREEGYSINEISKKLNVAKSSVSLWVRDIKLNPKQLKNLSERGMQVGVIEKRRETRLENEAEKRQVIVNIAQKQIKKISLNELWLIGTMLYWAEGGKTQRGLVRFSNGDPEMIRIMMSFFRKICKVPENKFRGYIHIHPHLNHKKAEKYWSSISRIPLRNFFKTYRKINILSKNMKDSLPFGVMDIYICSTELFLKISGWAKGIFNSY
jgi:predicted transcriptional regulator